MSMDSLRLTVAFQVEKFKGNALFGKLEAGTLTRADYQRLLLTIFHQTYEGPYTFAQAGVACPWRLLGLKEYLLHHAEEEKSHWKWVVGDLQELGYDGPDPRDRLPEPPTLAYVAFNHFVAQRHPPARIAVATVLEAIGAELGGPYGRATVKQLGLRPNQVTFFLAHGSTDKEHIEDLWEVIGAAPLEPEEWRWMIYAAEQAGRLYAAMFDHAVRPDA